MIKAIFLDRDGVINKYPGDGLYVTCLKDFKILPGVTRAIKRLAAAQYKIFVISNQAGVTKGIYTKKTLDQMTRYMLKKINLAGGRLDKVLYCLHTQDQNCLCRKPKDGLLKKATRAKKVSLKESYFIGDSILDIKAGKTFGCKTILVLSGREKLKNASRWDVAPDFIARSLAQAADRILTHKYERA